MARWTASAKWAAGPALDGWRDMPLALRLSEGLGVTGCPRNVRIHVEVPWRASDEAIGLEKTFPNETDPLKNAYGGSVRFQNGCLNPKQRCLVVRPGNHGSCDGCSQAFMPHGRVKVVGDIC